MKFKTKPAKVGDAFIIVPRGGGRRACLILPNGEQMSFWQDNDTVVFERSFRNYGDSKSTWTLPARSFLNLMNMCKVVESHIKERPVLSKK